MDQLKNRCCTRPRTSTVSPVEQEQREREREILELALPVTSFLDLPLVRGRIVHHYRVRALPDHRARFHLLPRPGAAEITAQRTNVLRAR